MRWVVGPRVRISGAGGAAGKKADFLPAETKPMSEN
jgi:hypothetical protein